ncbi:MAG: S41 family peptidase [Polyangiaceae bacterium]
MATASKRAPVILLHALSLLSCATPAPTSSSASSRATTTAAPPGSPSAESSVTASPFEASLASLEEAIRVRYAHRDRRGIDWPKRFEDARRSLSGVTTKEGFVQVLAGLLGEAQDPHIAIVTARGVTGTDPRKIPQNVELAPLRARVPDLKFPGRCLSTGTVDGFAYALLNSLEKGKCDRLPDEWDAAWPELARSRGMIVDMRGNQGGNEEYGRAIAGHFVSADTPYVRTEALEPPELQDPTGREPLRFAAPYTHVLRARGAAPYGKPVVVLIGALDMSSAELFVLMMRAAGATLVGARTRGASANPRPIPIGEDLVVNIPSWRASLLDGTPLEGIGIAPDRPVETTPESFASTDPVIDAAVAVLRERVR